MPYLIFPVLQSKTTVFYIQYYQTGQIGVGLRTDFFQIGKLDMIWLMSLSAYKELQFMQINTLWIINDLNNYMSETIELLINKHVPILFSQLIS